MDVAEEYLMTARAFNAKTRQWTLQVFNVSRGVLRTQTHASGKLAGRMSFNLRYDKDKEWIERIGFRFYRYGAFREYGAGRGYIVQNGVIRRGYRLWNAKKNTWNNMAVAQERLKRKGSSLSKIKKEKVATSGVIKRKPLSWLDRPLRQNLPKLADIVGEFYGDMALRNVLSQLHNITIRKNG